MHADALPPAMTPVTPREPVTPRREGARRIGLAAALLIGGSRSPKVGDIAPPFEITLVDGTKIKSEELRGSNVRPTTAPRA